MMDFRFLWDRIRLLVLDPEKAWYTICNESKPTGFIRNSFFLPLVILAAISAFFGSLLFTNTGVSTAYSVLAGIKYLVLYTSVVYATTYVYMKITSYLNIKNDIQISFKIIVFSAAPFLLCQIISRLFESFIFINILSLYGLYLLWLGNERLIDPPEKLKTPLLLAGAIVFTGFFIIFDRLLTTIVDRVYFAFFA